jgi:hypothetical protein
MNTEDIVKVLAPWVSEEMAREALELPLRLLPEEVDYALPSMAMRQDGPGIQSVFLLSANLLAEVRLVGPDKHFDFADLRTIVNYRVSFFTHAVNVKKDEAEDEDAPLEKIIYPMATIFLQHSFSMHTEIHYIGAGYRNGEEAGEERADWVADIAQRLPIALLIGGA